MKPVQLAVVLGTLTLFSGAAAAASGSLTQFNPRTMPVLVQVNSHGKVTDASPAMELTPKLNRLLLANLDEMIRAPATDKRGRPMSSQFVINLVLQASPLDNGNFDAKFGVVSTAPVPAGSWYWVHVDGDQVRLARRESSYRRQRLFDDPQQRRESNYRPSPQPAATRQSENATPNTPAPVSTRNPEQGR